tara:strand:+ start:1759 stop:1914 length:156 start_codon:yes stop_codon:yes gene_type:complete
MIYYQITIAEKKPYWSEQIIIMKSNNKSNLMNNLISFVHPATITVLKIKEL